MQGLFPPQEESHSFISNVKVGAIYKQKVNDAVKSPKGLFVYNQEKNLHHANYCALLLYSELKLKYHSNRWQQVIAGGN